MVSALHIGLCSLGIKSDCGYYSSFNICSNPNAISYCGATPILDVDQDTLSLCPVALAEWLDENALIKDGFCVNKDTNKRIAACIPMHTFGLPARLSELKKFVINIL